MSYLFGHFIIEEVEKTLLEKIYLSKNEFINTFYMIVGEKDC